MARRFVLLVVMAEAVLLVCSAVAFAAVKSGTGGNDRLVGTAKNDRFTGKGGNDKTFGKGGNDTYFYADGWGKDTVVDSGGTDTLDLSRVTEPINASLCTEGILGTPPAGASDSGNNTVVFASRIEKLKGGSGGDQLSGCAGKNTLSGGGGFDVLFDLGGAKMCDVAVPASNDVCADFKPGSGGYVLDGGGADDLLSLSAFDSEEVTPQAVDMNGDGTALSMVLYLGGDGGGAVLIVNQFGQDIPEFGSNDGRIESIKFKNGTVSTELSSPPEAVSARQAAALEKQMPEGLLEGNLLP